MLRLFSLHFCELRSVSLGNPRCFWCYSDEDMVGQLVEVPESLSPEHEVNHSAFQVVDILCSRRISRTDALIPLPCRKKNTHIMMDTERQNTHACRQHFTHTSRLTRRQLNARTPRLTRRPHEAPHIHRFSLADHTTHAHRECHAMRCISP